MRSPWNLAALCLVVFGILAGCERIWESDILWYLTAGQWILHHHQLLGQDYWSATPSGTIVNNYWLFETVVAGLFAIGGFAALSVLKGLLLGGIAYLLARTVPVPSRNAIAMVCLTVAVTLIQLRTRARPEEFTLFYLALCIWILESVRQGASNRRLWGLVPLMILWVNMHSLYILGLLTIWLSVAGAWWEERSRTRNRPPGSSSSFRALATAAAAATAACLITPEPLRVLAHPFVFWGQIATKIPEYGQAISELVPSYADAGSPKVWMTAALVVAAGAGLVLQRRRFPRVHLLWLAAFIYLGVTASRNLALTALVAGVVSAVGLGTIRIPRRVLHGVCLIVLILGMLYSIGFVGRITKRVASPGLGLQEDQYPLGIAQRIASAGPAGDILALDFGDAGALMYGANKDRIDPKAIIHRVWIDGRTDLHSREAYGELLRIREATAESPDAAARVSLPPTVRYLVVSFNDLAMLSNVAACPRFRLFHLDRNHACFMRTDIAGGSVDFGDNLAEYDRPLHLDPPQALLGPTDRYRRTWWRQHPLATHWTLGTVLPFVGRGDLAARYLECAELLGNGPAADRRGMLAMVLADLASGDDTGNTGIGTTGMPTSLFAIRAMWLLDQPGVCDLDTWEGRTHDLARVDLLRRGHALDLADRAIRRHLADPDVKRAGEVDPETQALQVEIAQALGAASRVLSDPTLSAAPPIEQAGRLMKAGLTEEALKRLDRAEARPRFWRRGTFVWRLDGRRKRARGSRRRMWIRRPPMGRSAMRSVTGRMDILQRA